jgi:hypothetical protein
MTLDGDESGGNQDLSADVMALCRGMLTHLASCGRRRDLVRRGCESRVSGEFGVFADFDRITAASAKSLKSQAGH